MDILILGATGFIGTAVMARLMQDGHRITGLGRDSARAARQNPGSNFVQADLARMQQAGDWTELVELHDVIVNCAGALQDGLRDDLAATQQRAMLALYTAAAAAGGRRIVQVSARLDGAGSDLAFLQTKARADAALKASGLDHVILRPALVIGRNAHGGTALLRALASFPRRLPLIHASSPVETVALDDVAEAVARAVDGHLPHGADLDLAAGPVLSLAQTVARHRQWLGFAPAEPVDLPPWLARPVIALADVAGRLGWRSALRSTAMAVMAEGVTRRPQGQAAPFPLMSLEETLARNPAGAQDLWFARLTLLKAPIILTLAVFWLVSGLIPLARYAVAASYLDGLLSPGPALLAVLAGCALDVALGLGLLFRPTARYALFGMIAASLVYLVAATITGVTLWLDPLGPLVKVVPSILLTLTALAILDER
ncbi:SDR family oxidoreductase [Hoeflea sp. YIM 152468]|uniref:SDR family oxidoreductase n=1 Tax=Hoeflea sp. YIM 152468 TaxID=3031759 RepID=UPI0023DAD5A4|nr:SDR family oxidoreductase [Hoeflea sp. YIM 152468]MDF1608436.1 SDR family oxidoreductase [Hoeflea sp. YIM 152468]